MENRVKKNTKKGRKKKSVTYSSCLHNQQDLYWGENLKGHCEEPQELQRVS